jgi:hypothetical protein
MEVMTTLGSILKFPLRPFIPFLSFGSTRRTIGGLTLEDAQLVMINPNGGLIKENNGLETSHLVKKSHRKSLRVGIPTREIGDIVGEVRGRPQKVKRNVEGQKEFGGGRVNGWMEVALKTKRLGPGEGSRIFEDDT